MEEWDDVTEPLRNGDPLPDHPALTTAKRIIEYGTVFDDATGTPLQGGLHGNEIAMLMNGEQMALRHLFRFAIRDKKLYHTRPLAVINVRTEDAEEVV